MNAITDLNRIYAREVCNFCGKGPFKRIKQHLGFCEEYKSTLLGQRVVPWVEPVALVVPTINNYYLSVQIVNKRKSHYKCGINPADSRADRQEANRLRQMNDRRRIQDARRSRQN